MIFQNCLKFHSAREITYNNFEISLQIMPITYTNHCFFTFYLHESFVFSNLEARDDKGCTPLHICAVFDRTKIARVLLKHGADANATDNEGSTPLHLASAFCDELVSKESNCNMVSLLLEYKANISLRDSEGSIPLHTAAAFGRKHIVRRLILEGSDVNAVDSNGDTPLHVSAGSGHLKVVLLLVDNGADLFAVDKEGLTAAACAEKFGHKETKQFLEESRYRCL